MAKGFNVFSGIMFGSLLLVIVNETQHDKNILKITRGFNKRKNLYSSYRYWQIYRLFTCEILTVQVDK